MQASQSGQPLGATRVLHNIMSEAGPRGLFAGLSPGLVRQATYGMPRLALYPILCDTFCGAAPRELDTWRRSMIGGMAGLAASFTGNPSEVLYVRMAADKALPANLRRNYTGLGDALWRTLSCKNGKGFNLKYLYRGLFASSARNMMFNCGQLGGYSEAKGWLRKHTELDGVALQFTSSFFASFLAVGLSGPADLVKSRMQSSVAGDSEETTLGVLRSIMRKDGIKGLWRGSGPALIMNTPHTIISFLVYEQLAEWASGTEAI